MRKTFLDAMSKCAGGARTTKPNFSRNGRAAALRGSLLLLFKNNPPLRHPKGTHNLKNV